MSNVCVRFSDKDTHLLSSLPPFAMQILFARLTSDTSEIGRHKVSIPIDDSTRLAATYEITHEEIGGAQTRCITIVTAFIYEAKWRTKVPSSSELATQISSAISNSLRNLDFALAESKAIAGRSEGDAA